MTYSVFSTLRGLTAAAFDGDALVRLELPDGVRPDGAAKRMRAHYPDAAAAQPTPAQQRTVDQIVKYLDGRSTTLSPKIPVKLDRAPPFFRRVYEALRTVPPGTTLSYAELAERAGNNGAARAVGTAMQKNPLPLVIPCHRVVRSGNELGPYSAPGGVALKRHLLEREGALPTLTIDDALRELSRRDRTLAKLMKRAPRYPLEPEAQFDLFDALSRTIVYQQLSGKAAATIYGRLEALLGTAKMKRAARLQSLSDAELRTAGLSGQKTLALRDLAAKHLAGELPTTAELALLDDDAVVGRLTQVRGIGRWSAEMLLMFRLGRLDVMPATDLGVQKGHALLYRAGKEPLDAKALYAFGERWRPYRSVASWYMWRAIEVLGKD